MLEIKEIFKDLTYYLPAKILPSFVNFLAISLFTNLLTPNEYGNYTIVVSTVTLISTIAITWISQANVRLFEKYKNQNELNSYFITNAIIFFFINLIVSILWVIVIQIIKGHINNQLFYFLKIGTAYLFFESGFSYTISYLRAQRKSKTFMKINLFKSIIGLLISVVIMYYLNFGAEVILITSALLDSIILVYFLIEVKNKFSLNIYNFSKKIFKNTYRYGIPLSLTAIGALTISLSDRYLIQHFLNSEAVGIYAAGNRLSQMSILLFSGIIIFAAFPILIKSYEQFGKQKAINIISKLTSIYIVTMTPILITVIVLAKDIVSLFLGEQYFLSYKIIPWVSAGAFLAGLSQYINKGFELTEKTNKLVYLILVTAIFNILLNIIFIPKYGFIAAGYSNFLSYFLYIILSWYFSRNVLRWKIPWVVIAKVCIPVFVIVIIFFINNWQTNNHFFNIIAKTGVILFTYVLFLFFLKEKLTITFFTKVFTLRSKKT